MAKKETTNYWLYGFVISAIINAILLYQINSKNSMIAQREQEIKDLDGEKAKLEAKIDCLQKSLKVRDSELDYYLIEEYKNRKVYELYTEPNFKGNMIESLASNIYNLDEFTGGKPIKSMKLPYEIVPIFYDKPASAGDERKQINSDIDGKCDKFGLCSDIELPAKSLTLLRKNPETPSVGDSNIVVVFNEKGEAIKSGRGDN